MKLLLKHLEPLGFKGTSMYPQARWQQFWYRKFPQKCVVIGLSCSIPEGIFRFDLSAKNMKRFQAGKLSLTPPGCCHPWSTPNLTRYTWVQKGEFKTQKEFREALKRTGLFPELTKKQHHTQP